MPDRRYLKLRHNTWHVVVEVPKALRKAAGVARFKRSLGTASLPDADRRKHSVVAEFKRRIDLLKRGSGVPSLEVFKKATALRNALSRASSLQSTDPQAESQSASDHEEYLDLIKEEANEILAERGVVDADRFYSIATGNATFVREAQISWLNELSPQDAKAQTKAHHASAVRNFVEWAGEAVTIEETGRRKAGEYIGHMIQRGLARKTIKRHASSLSSFWRWLASRGLATENPWRGHELGKRGKDVKVARKPFTDDDLVALLSGKSTRKFTLLLHDLMRLAVSTGARLDELCSIRQADVEKRSDGYWVRVSEGKTDAATRIVPIHASVAHVMDRRLGETDEFLFPNLTPGGPDKKRSWYVSKAFARFSNGAGIKDPSKVFHSFRMTFMEMMEGQEVPESTVKLLVGHKRSSLTFGHYSQGERVSLRKAIGALKYGPAVMKLLKATPADE